MTIILQEYDSFTNGHKKTWARESPVTNVQTELYVFLWFAANKCSLRDVALKFGISVSTAHKVIEKIMEFLVSLGPKYIQFSRSEAEKAEVAEKFVSVLGCIDGTSIHIQTPAHKIKSTYVNRHDIPCLTLQAICDYNKCFIDVFTGIPGKIHYARVLKLSMINSQLPMLCEKGNYHIIGDSAYSIREWLLTPYRDYGNLTADEKQFNKKICATRVLIENVFGLLKGRFRQLFQVSMHSVDKISKFIVSCCILHNLCVVEKDSFPLESPPDQPQDEANELIDNEKNLRQLGEMKINLIKTRIVS